MADEVQYYHQEIKRDEPCDSAATPAAPKAEEIVGPGEATDRGLFDFVGKKEEEKTCEEAVIVAQFAEKVEVCDREKKEEHKEEEEKKREGLLEKLHRSSSSSSDEEEVGEDGEKKKKKKKKKGLKEKIEEKISGEHKEEDTSVPVEKCDDTPTPEPEEKGLLEKIKEKLPGGKKGEEVETPTAVECAAVTSEAEGKEKKGFLDKIKEKIPGHHSKSDEEKEKEKEEAACH
jgi:uncharacterized protein with von Willebrand factor type A (vWA) domain